MDSTVVQIQIPSFWVVLATIALTILGVLLVQNFLGKANNGKCTGNPDTCEKEKCIPLLKKDMSYLIIIFVIIITFLIVDLFIGKKEAMEYFSFASTITSIILSVLAIMMTIFSDSKTENTKALINKSVESLKDTKESIQKYSSELESHNSEQERIFKDILDNSKQTLSLAKGIDKNMAAFKLIPSKDIPVEEIKPSQYKSEEVESI